MVVLKILIRILCVILFVVSIPLVPLQVLVAGIVWCFKGGYSIDLLGSPLPFAVVDWIDTICDKHGIDLTTNR